MNRKEHLLTILAEECMEIGKECTKALRFGINDHHPTQTGTNAQKINDEFNDLVAVIDMLNNEGHLDVNVDLEKIEKKKERVEKYLLYSKEHGTLND
jgi:NTP pyrophosphatase (non-canonical NTP hydrolase)